MTRTLPTEAARSFPRVMPIVAASACAGLSGLVLALIPSQPSVPDAALLGARLAAGTLFVVHLAAAVALAFRVGPWALPAPSRRTRQGASPIEAGRGTGSPGSRIRERNETGWRPSRGVSSRACRDTRGGDAALLVNGAYRAAPAVPGGIPPAPAAPDWEALVENAPVGISMLGPDLTLMSFNARMNQFFHGALRLGQTPAACVPQLGSDASAEAVRLVMAEGMPLTLRGHRVDIRDASGVVHSRWFDFVSQPLRDRDGALLGVVNFAHEVTDLIQAQGALSRMGEKIRHEKDKYSSIVELVPQIIWISDARGETTFVNGRLGAYAGVEGRELLGNGWSRLIHPDDRAGVAARWKACVRDSVSYDDLYRMRRADGEYRWFMVRGNPLRDGQDRIVQWFGTCTDVHESRQLSENVRVSESRYRVLAEAVPHLIWTRSAEGGPEYLNPQWAEYLDPRSPTARSESFVGLIHPDDRESVLARMEIGRRAGEAVGVAGRLLRRDGVFRWHLFRLRPVRGEDGGVLDWIGTATDIQEQRDQLEKTLRAEEDLRSAIRVRDDFLATLSHELRTPMAVVLGWLQILRQNRGEVADLPRVLGVLERNARIQIQVIDDLLDVSRIIKGKFVMKADTVDIVATVDAGLESIRLSAEQKGVSLAVHRGRGVRPVVGDTERLQQVVWNLLSNAIKFTPSGGSVRVSVAREVDGVRLDVLDTGEGIEPEFLPHVFERFRQEDSGTRRRRGGLGLGLAIVRHIVELHGGSVAVASDGKGKGSVFTVRLPVRAFASVRLLPSEFQGAGDDGAAGLPPYEDAPFPGEGHQARKPLQGYKLLVVDDCAEVRDVMQLGLGAWGADVRSASGVWDAVAQLRREDFDLVVSDIAMPEEDGYRLLERLREIDGRRGTRTPAIALTAYALEEERERALRMGFDAHLAKPALPSALLAAMLVLLERAETRGSVTG